VNMVLSFITGAGPRPVRLSPYRFRGEVMSCRDICEMALKISESRFRELRLDSLDVLPGAILRLYLIEI
jgi:hypothetical protein